MEVRYSYQPCSLNDVTDSIQAMYSQVQLCLSVWQKPLPTHEARIKPDSPGIHRM